MWARSPTLRSGRTGTAQSILADRPSRHLGRLIDKPSDDRALPLEGWITGRWGVIVMRQRISRLASTSFLSRLTGRRFDHGREKVGCGAEQPMRPTPDMPAAVPFQALPSRRSKAGVG